MPESPMKIAYAVSRFPVITETFILREIASIEALGVDVELYPLQRQSPQQAQPQALQYIENANYLPWLSFAILWGNLQCFIKSPARYVKTLFNLLRANLGSARFFAGAIAFFPKAVLMARKMQAADTTHLHAHFASHPAAVAWVIHQLTGIPYSFTAHGSDLHRCQKMLAEKVESAAFVVAISKYNHQIIADHSSEKFHHKIKVIHCGIDLPHDREPAGNHTCDADEKIFKVVCVGTLHEVKGQRFLIEACVQLLTQGTDVQCEFVGDGPDRDLLQQIVKEHRLEEKMVFHGRRTTPEVQEIVSSADLLVAPSVPTKDGRREGIPVVLMEALSWGVPVVASDLSGIPELVQHEVTGLLVPPGNVDELAQAIQRFSREPGLKELTTMNAYRLLESSFNNECSTRQLLHLIKGHERHTHASSRPVADLQPKPHAEVAEELCCH